MNLKETKKSISECERLNKKRSDILDEIRKSDPSLEKEGDLFALYDEIGSDVIKLSRLIDNDNDYGK